MCNSTRQQTGSQLWGITRWWSLSKPMARSGSGIFRTTPESNQTQLLASVSGHTRIGLPLTPRWAELSVSPLMAVFGFGSLNLNLFTVTIPVLQNLNFGHCSAFPESHKESRASSTRQIESRKQHGLNADKYHSVFDPC